MDNSFNKGGKKNKRAPKYCCICKGIYRGAIINGRTVKIHRFPQNKQLKRVWIRRCKTVMRTFQWTSHKRLCSEHFIGFMGPSPQCTLPSIFPTEGGGVKNFPTCKLDENQSVQLMDVEIEHTDIDSSDEGEPVVVNLCAPSSSHPIDISVRYHDYCQGQFMSQITPKTRNVDTQTDWDYRDSSVQTEEVAIKKSTDAFTQTDTFTNSISVQCNLPLLTFQDVKHSDDMVSFYTGLPSAKVFEAVFDEIKTEAVARTSRGKSDGGRTGRPRTLTVINEFFMVLMRLRLGLLLDDLSYRFCISTSQCSNIIERWINYLVVQLSFLVQWPSRQTVNENMPRCFKDKFPNTRIIIDCTELYSDSSSSLSLKSLMYSDYKSHMTHKALVGISPNGVVTFVSDCWVGSASDKKITAESGLLDLLEEGDAIMVDKGFTITDLTTPKGVALIIPPFRTKGKQFSQREVLLTKDIARRKTNGENKEFSNSSWEHSNYPGQANFKFI